MMNKVFKGSCLCGAIEFEVSGSLDKNDACHCIQCRKWTGHYFAGADIERSNLVIKKPERVSWYESSSRVRRGFCPTCGSSLFFDPLDKKKHDWIGITLGSLDSPSETRLAKHIFVSEKGDYYKLSDGVPQE